MANRMQTAHQGGLIIMVVSQLVYHSSLPPWPSLDCHNFFFFALQVIWFSDLPDPLVRTGLCRPTQDNQAQAAPWLSLCTTTSVIFLLPGSPHRILVCSSPFPWHPLASLGILLLLLLLAPPGSSWLLLAPPGKTSCARLAKGKVPLPCHHEDLLRAAALP